MITKEHLDKLRIEFVRTQSRFATVIQELEADLTRMRDNERIPQEIITKRDEQIETLIGFNNKIEDLIKIYQMALINYHYELQWTDNMLWRAMQKNHDAMNEFIEGLSKTGLSSSSSPREPDPGPRQRDT